MPRRPVVARSFIVTECDLIGIDKYSNKQVTVHARFPRTYKTVESLVNKARKRFENRGFAVADAVNIKVYRLSAHMDEEDFILICTDDSLEEVK